MWRDAWMMVAKDLRIEARSRVAAGQVAPFAVLVLVLFAFALDPSRLPAATAGLYWVAVLLSAVLGVQRSFSIESADSARDGLRLSGLDPAGIFFGKATALALQLLILEIILGAGIVILYGARLHEVLLLSVACLAATVGLSAAGMVYGVMASGLRIRETLLPLLFLPVVAPVLIAATKASQAALSTAGGRAQPWITLLAVFAVVYVAVGAVRVCPPDGGRVTKTSEAGADATPRRRNRSRLATRLLGLSALSAVVLTVVMGLWLTPPDVVQGGLVRLIYLHPPVAWVAYVAFAVTAVASLLYLWPRTRARRWDCLAGASAEIAVVFTALTLATGSIWGRPTWGVWWTWDARLTTTALLLVLFLGYLALRRVPGDTEVRARRSAIAALVAAVDVPIVHMSVIWWRTLHQPPTVLNSALNPSIHGSMAWTLLLAFCAFTLVYLWLLVHRYRAQSLEAEIDDHGLELALEERRAEGTGDVFAPSAAEAPVEPVRSKIGAGAGQ